MTIWSNTAGALTKRRRSALLLLWGALPFLGLAYQIAARQTAASLADTPLGPVWLVGAISQPWGLALLGLEAASFAAWMVVLSEIKLSAAFPLSALSYVFVVAAGWTLFGERIEALQIIGGALIMTGVWMIGRTAKGAPR